MTQQAPIYDQPQQHDDGGNSRREQRGGAGKARAGKVRQAVRKGRDGSVPAWNANGDDILTADDRAALEVVLADQDKAKLEPAERLERHFRAGHFILRGDAYAIRMTNGHMGRVYAKAANEWIRASRIDRHPLLRRKGTRTSLRHMSQNEVGLRVWFLGTPEKDELGNAWPGLDIDDQIRTGHPDTFWTNYCAFLNAIFTAAGFVSTVEDRQDAIAAKQAIAEQADEARAWWEEQQALARNHETVELDNAPVKLLHLPFDEVRQRDPVALLSEFQRHRLDAVRAVVAKVIDENAAEAAKQAEETERERQEQKAENRRNRLAEFNQFGRHDIDKLTCPDWEKEPDPIKAERKAIEQLDGDLSWLENDLIYGCLNLPALIRGLRKDETARAELLERLETWACFIAGLREKVTAPAEPPEPPKPKGGGDARARATVLANELGNAQPPKAEAAPGGEPEAALENPPRVLSAEVDAAGAAGGAAEPTGTPIPPVATTTRRSLNWHEKHSDDGKFAYHEAKGRAASYMITIRLARLEDVEDKNPWELSIFKHGDRSGGAFALADSAGAYSTLALAQAAAQSTKRLPSPSPPPSPSSRPSAPTTPPRPTNPTPSAPATSSPRAAGFNDGVVIGAG